MKKKYIKPIIEYCPLESDIMAASLITNTNAVGDSDANPISPNGSTTGDPVQNESKENFWNLWEDDDMEFEF